jgi:hypothetical protein
MAVDHDLEAERAEAERELRQGQEQGELAELGSSHDAGEQHARHGEANAAGGQQCGRTERRGAEQRGSARAKVNVLWASRYRTLSFARYSLSY